MGAGDQKTTMDHFLLWSGPNQPKSTRERDLGESVLSTDNSFILSVLCFPGWGRRVALRCRYRKPYVCAVKV